MTNFMHAFQAGGIFMWMILAFGVASIIIMAERFYTLYIKTKPISAATVTQLRNLFQSGNLAEAAQVAQQSPLLNSIVNAGIDVRKKGLSEDELRARMDDELSSQISKLDKGTGFLAMLGNVATLAGLLGTISGMIKSFAAVASASPAERASMLSLGISEAMNCTAFGLVIAIPTLVIYAIMQNKTDKITTSMTENASVLFHDLLFRIEVVTSGKNKHRAPYIPESSQRIDA